MSADAWAVGITFVDPEVKVAGLSWVAGLQGTCCTCRRSGCSASRGKGTCPVHLCVALALLTLLLLLRQPQQLPKRPAAQLASQLHAEVQQRGVDGPRINGRAHRIASKIPTNTGGW